MLVLNFAPEGKHTSTYNIVLHIFTMFFKTSLFTVLLVFVIIKPAKNERFSFFKPCSKSSPDLNNCLMKNAQNMVSLVSEGIPEINLLPFDPYEAEDAEQNIDTGTIVYFKNLSIHGIKNAIFNNISLNLKKKKILVDFNCTGKAVFIGQMIAPFMTSLITVDAEIQIFDFNFIIKINYDERKSKKDKKMYWRITKHKATVIPNDVKIISRSLINNDKPFTNYAVNFLQSNWKILFEIGAKNLLQNVGTPIVNRINQIFESVPVDDLILP